MILPYIYPFLCKLRASHYLFISAVFIPYLLDAQPPIQKDTATLETIVITQSKEQKTREALMGVEKINAQLVNKLPFFGERDMMAVTKMMPGIKSAGGGQGSLSIRGGGYDQNLVLLDDVPVYNPAHMLGAFSVFHSDAVKNITLYKGTAPARYGGRTSGVIDAHSWDGDSAHYFAKGGVGIITSRLSVEGPLQKGKSSFFVSGRRTYADILATSIAPRFKGNELYFYDANAKLTFHLNPQNKLSFTGYYGNDRLALQELFRIQWGNAVATMHYEHKFAQSALHTRISFNQYEVNLSMNREDTRSTNVAFLSRIRELSVKQEWETEILDHKILAGFSVLHRNNIPGNIFRNESSLLPLRRNMLEMALYAQDHWKIHPQLKLQYGLRLQSYLVLGGDDFYTLDADRNHTATFHPTGIVRQYFSPEPRIALNYAFLPHHSLKIAYNRNAQGVFLINNAIASLPTDRWITASNNIPFVTSDIGAIGYTGNTEQWEFSVETYYKTLHNITDYKDGANDMDSIIDQQLLIGNGRAYGVEFLVRKKAGVISGWIAYTLARTEQRVPGANNDQWYPARQDRRHDFNIALILHAHARLTLALLWTYQTGRAFSMPAGKYQLLNKTVFLYTARNSGRMPPFHHLDLSLTYRLKKYKHLHSELSFSIFNIYARENPFLIQFKEDPIQPNKINTIQTALFSIIPSLSWNFTIL